MRFNRYIKILLVFFISSMMVIPWAHAARVKDIASIGGVRDNQLIGYGLVVGLSGTGDSIKNGFTNQTLANLLTRQGLSMKDRTLKAKNVAAVMITAKLPPFAKIGTRIDVMVSSIGDSTSLLGGTLLMTPLRGADGKIYAVAQGALIIGGFSAGGGGAGITKNHATVGRITNGALIEKELHYDFDQRKAFAINLHRPDFTTCSRLSDALNRQIPVVEAKLVDSNTVTVSMKESFHGDIVSLISTIENLDVPVDSVAMVVLNEKTGTVVMGDKVRVSTIAIAHGNLSIQIKETQHVSQPLPFTPGAPGGTPPIQMDNGTIVAPGGQTVVTSDQSVDVAEEKRKLMVVPQGVTIQEVVNALNAIGVSPRDLIAILQTIKAAGALQADLIIM
jgi:flagellar P-ring protein precursor FlgI